MASVAEVGAPEGTSIEVDDLFYNLPARRKFLKSDGAESAQVSRIVTQLALAYPEVGFTLTSGGAHGARSVRRRRRCATGCIRCTASATICVEVRKEAGGMRVTGFVAALAEQGPTRGPQNVFVNRRIVKDRTIAHAIIDCLQRRRRSRSAAPRCTCSSRCRPTRVDVNVHPTKAEVRFREQSLVHEVVRRALMDALGQSGAPQLQLRPEHAGQPPVAPSLPGVLAGGVYPNRWQPGTVRLKPDATYEVRPADVGHRLQP